jgi:DNA-binding NarL/FixJ family response regulator
MTGAALRRVFVVDDHALVRSGVRAELAGRVEFVGEAGDVESAVAGILVSDPEVVLVDVHLPGGQEGAGVPLLAGPAGLAPGALPQAGGAEVIRRVLARKPDVRFLALSVSDAPEDVIATIRAGARGYLTKSVFGDDLADAIDRVAGGDAVFSPRLAGFVLDAFAGVVAAPAGSELDQLTPREREVLRHIARGYAYKEVARQLSLSVKTVETHVSSVLRKLQLSSRHELTRWATDRRLV